MVIGWLELMEKKPNLARAKLYVNMGAIMSTSFFQFWAIV
jgi:hypothetical protein